MSALSFSDSVHPPTVLIVTDAWHPQLNGVVRTLEELARSMEGRACASCS
ncbi:hypothetical protein [Thauera sp. SDU_THAU2]